MTSLKRLLLTSAIAVACVAGVYWYYWHLYRDFYFPGRYEDAFTAITYATAAAIAAVATVIVVHVWSRWLVARNVSSKRATIVGTVALALIAVLTAHNRYLLWGWETGTQLLWNDKEAYLFINTRQAGWGGNDLRYSWKFLRAALGESTIDDLRSTVIVFHFVGDRIEKRVVHDVHSPELHPFDGQFYGKVNGVFSRWTGHDFAPASGDEQRRLLAAGFRIGDVRNPLGWSRNVMLLAFGRPRHCHALPDATDGRQLCFDANFSSSGRQTVELQLPRGRRQSLWSIDGTLHKISRREYEATFPPREWPATE